MLLPPSIALFAWPVVTGALFAAKERKVALVVTVLCGYLLLPEKFNIDLPSLPPLNKNSVTVFALLLCLLIFKEKVTLRGPQPTSNLLINDVRWFGYILIGLITLMFINGLITVQTNREPLIWGTRFIPALGTRDVINQTVATLVLTTPYILGWAFFRTTADHRFLLRCLVAAGLAYSVLVLYEMRFSPQLHAIVYGYHQHSFAQHVRGGHFRPKVFTGHGLEIGLFAFMVVVAAASLYRNKIYANRGKWLFICAYMVVILYLSRNLGAFMLAVMLTPLLWTKIRISVLFAAVIALLFLLYPAVRQANLVPLDRVTSFAASISEERAQSFEFRLRNEDILLERALIKPLSGWGNWGRNRVYNEKGVDLSVTDGIWVIILGTSGWIGYITFFGLLSAPLLALFWVSKRREIQPETVAIALIMAGNLIYLVPNSTLTPVGWLITGALAGFVQYKEPGGVENQLPAAKTGEGGASPYTRFPHRPAKGKPKAPQPVMRGAGRRMLKITSSSS